ncbi:hypothetical protein NE237_012175 [Protea cynaroides]|uniref:Uncharacterized protein n=1 Tax=Protea cynaroides TaxID=273540 RepID=A0A9Q0H0K2_9MAGN|nr:hypothetical protein NE237_012175 [Protea cynaroides]
MVAHGTMLNGRLFVLYTVSALRLYLSIFSYFAAVVAELWPMFAIAPMMSIQMKSILFCANGLSFVIAEEGKTREDFDIIPYYKSFSLFTIVKTTTKISRKLSNKIGMILKECCREHGFMKTLALRYILLET